MKNFFFTLIFLLLLIYQTSSFGQPHQSENIILLSFPRSGNTWTRYCLEFLTKRPSGEYRYLFPRNPNSKSMNDPLNNHFNLGVDYSFGKIIKLHSNENIRPKIPSPYLILVVRNYKECFLRHFETPMKAFEYVSKKNNWYYNNIKFYDDWDSQKKLLIYYEDLILNPSKVFEQISNFFGCDNNFNIFLNDFEKHKKNCIEIYERFEKHSRSKGNTIEYHSKQLSKELKKSFDEQVQTHLPALSEKYLQRYFE